MKLERTLILIKPDALQRNLVGNILSRFERKGLKIMGMKMISISDAMVIEHYAHHQEKPFFAGLKRFMQSSPVIAVVLEGIEVVATVRTLLGATSGRKADVGTIRGDLCISAGSPNLVHASDSVESAEAEIKRFFQADEIFDYKKIDWSYVYDEEEMD